MKVLRALFWVIAVSFLLAGGNGLSESYGHVPGSSYVGPESPAYASSERVVASVAKLKGTCQRQEQVCSVFSKAGEMLLDGIDAAMRLILGGLSETSDEADRDGDGNGLFGSDDRGDQPDTSFFFGIDTLFYEGVEELEDIG